MSILSKYNTVTRAQLAISGYVRIHSNKIIPQDITDYFCYFFGYFYLKPDSDPSNFISEFDITKSKVSKTKGNILIKQHSYKEALKQYTHALSCNPNCDKIRCNRSLCYLKLKKFEKAFSDAFHAIIQHPLSHKSWLRLAQALEAMENYDQCLNIIEHGIELSDATENDGNKKLFTKYYASVEQKSKTHAKLRNICAPIKSHMFDKDREEWKFCTPGKMDENKMTDQELLIAPAFKTRHYSKSIIPSKLRKQYWTARGFFAKRAARAEFDRWLNREWIKKVHIFERIDQCKSLIRIVTAINRGVVPQVLGEKWIISWTATENIFLNKRCVAVTIHRCGDKPHWLFTEDTYGKPNAQFMIDCLKKTMWSPSDAIEQWVERYCRCGKKYGHIPYGVVPSKLFVAWRARDEFEEIFEEMLRFGILCELVSYEESVKAANNHKTNPNGWNYLDHKPHYIDEIDVDSPSVRLMQMDVMRLT